MPKGIPASGSRQTKGEDPQLAALTQNIKNARIALKKQPDNEKYKERLQQRIDAKAQYLEDGYYIC